jgi:hypothetical protein
MSFKMASLVVSIFIFASCERSARQVVLQNACDSKETNRPKGCIKNDNNDGSKDPLKPNDPSKPDPPKPVNPQKPDPPKPVNPQKPDPPKPVNPQKPDPQKPDPQKPDPQKPDPQKPDPSKPNVPSTSSDQTSNANLGIFISSQGIPTLVFGGNNISKFSAMQYSTEALTLTAPASAMMAQGQTVGIGQIAVKASFTFKFDGKSCSGTSTAKFGQQTSVTVSCR